MKKIAFLSCGMLRTFEHCVNTWNIFDSCDIFVYTWDKTSRPFTNDFSIIHVSDLEEAKKNKHITDYEVLCHKEELDPQKKNPYLWNYIAKHLSWDYDYVFITRPDIVLNKTNKIIYPGKNEISLLWHDDDAEIAQDLALFMRRDVFYDFSLCFNFLKDLKHDEIDIHKNLYHFIKTRFTITNTLSSFISSSLVRPNVNTKIFSNEDIDYSIQQEVITWEESTKFQHALSKLDKRTAILLITDKQNTIKDRDFISKKHKKHLPFFFESMTEEMARDKCAKYEEKTGLKFDEIIIEYNSQYL